MDQTTFDVAFDAGVIATRLAAVREQLQAIATTLDMTRSPDMQELPPTFPVSWLSDQLRLTPTEVTALWVLLAHELCPRSREAMRQLTTEDIADVTLDSLRRAAYGAPSVTAWRDLSATGTLMRSGLIERDVAAAAEHRQAVRVNARVVALLHGVLELDGEVRAFARFDDSTVTLAELEVDGDAVRAIEHACERDGLVIVRGGAGTGRRSLVSAIARARGHRLLVVDGGALATDRERAARQLRIIARECVLFGAVPMIRQLDALAGTGELAERLDLIESELGGLILATTTRPIARRWRRPPVSISLPALTGHQRARVWAGALPSASASDADVLSTMYPLAPSLIRAAGEAALRQTGGAQMEPEHVEAGIRAVLDDRLAGLATRITVTQTWDDLILPEEQITSIVELLARIRERRKVYEDWGFARKVGKGLGVSALFSGPPGTGKTMCAGLIAGDLRTALYQVDLSKITSKWIGETEKNLAALFDAAEAGHAILLFDEADSLFGKRTDVRSSNDRHANQETNYLLQRLETFNGICILTTNHESAIDEAFRRRLSVHVRFPVPEAEERTLLWQALIPKAAPVAAELALDQLGEHYVMSGGYIRNAVLRAAFLAADQNTPIQAAHLARAAQLEYEAMGKVVARHAPVAIGGPRG